VRLRIPLLLALVGACALAACGGDDGAQSNAQRFCAEATAHRNAIVDPPVSDEAGLEATLDFYRLMGQLAPVSIAGEWEQLIVNLETAASFDPADRESEQRVVATAYATEAAAFEVWRWLDRNCGLRLPITTIAPHELAPAATLPGPETTPPTSVADAG
jgi:hypothetical protein